MKNSRTNRLKTVNAALKYVVIPLMLGLLLFLTVINVYPFVMDKSSPSHTLVISNTDSNISKSDTSSPHYLVLDEPENTRNDCEEINEELRTQLDKLSKSYRSTAVQAAVIRNGVVCAYYNYGFADKDDKKPVTSETVFRAASLSKLVDAMAVMKLSEHRVMDIDSDIGDYLGYRVRSKKFPDAIITPRMLMVHTSGIIDSENFLDSRNNHSSTPLKKLLLESASYSGNCPGSEHSYSNFGIAVLTAAAEKASNQPFYAYTEDEIFKPIGVRGSFLASRIKDSHTVACLYNPKGKVSYSVQRQLNEACHEELGQTHHIYQGNLTISAMDYAKLLCVLLNDGKDENGNQLLAPESVNEILKIQYQSGKKGCCLCNFTSDSIVEGRTMHYHTGSNFGMYSSFAFDTSDRSGVVVLSSGADAQKEKSGVYDICGDIIRTIYRSNV